MGAQTRHTVDGSANPHAIIVSIVIINFIMPTIMTIKMEQ